MFPASDDQRRTDVTQGLVDNCSLPSGQIATRQHIWLDDIRVLFRFASDRAIHEKGLKAFGHRAQGDSADCIRTFCQEQK